MLLLIVLIVLVSAYPSLPALPCQAFPASVCTAGESSENVAMLYSTARLHSAMPTGNTRIPLVGTQCYKGQIVGTNGVRYRGVPARLSHAENFTTLRKEFLFRLSQIKCPHFQENVFQRVVCVFI